MSLVSIDSSKRRSPSTHTPVEGPVHALAEFLVIHLQQIGITGVHHYASGIARQLTRLGPHRSLHSPQRFAARLAWTSEAQTAVLPLASKLSSTPPRRDEQRNNKGGTMFGPRRGYDAIGEAPVSNADKPRVQPVKVDPKVLMTASRGAETSFIRLVSRRRGRRCFFSRF